MITNTGISKSALSPAIENLAYTKEETNELLADKADKATTLAGYGITNGVTTNTVQEITANKTFKSRATFDYYNPELTLDRGNSIGINVRLKEDTYNVAPVADKSYTQMVYDKDGVNQGQIQFFHGSSGSRIWRMGAISNTGASKAVDLVHIDNDGTAYMLGLSRDYNANNQSDVATIKTLDQYGPMVRTTNAQTIAGVKTFTNPQVFSATLSYVMKSTAAHGTIPTSNDYREFAYRMGGNDANHGLISFITEAPTGNGNLRLRMRDYAGANTADFNIYAGSDKYMTGPSRAYNASNTTDVATIATLDGYSPMVRTSGNQTKAGTLTLTSSVIEDVTYYSHMVAIPDIRDTTALKVATIQRMLDNDNRPVAEEYIIKEANGTIEHRFTISYTDANNTLKRGDLKFLIKPDGKVALGVRKSDGTTHYIYEET